METYLAITPHTSITRTVVPFLKEALFTRGYALLRMENSAKLKEDILVLTAIAGQAFAPGLSYHMVESKGSNEPLAAHTEGVSHSCGITPYFALGCVLPPAQGGETRIFDARAAAALLATDYPLLKDVVIEYRSLAHPAENACYPLVVHDALHGDVLRYRSEVVTNHISVLSETEAKALYAIVDATLERAIVLTHEWNIGDILFVNNYITLHDRLSFTGGRNMLRVRFGDTLNQRMEY